MIPYGRQSIDAHDVESVRDVLEGDWLTQGPTVELFENVVAEYVGAKFAVAFSSGTAALHGAVVAAKLGPGHQIATSPLTFMASANAARFVGASPQLVDINFETWNIDPDKIDREYDAVIPVHFAGLPADVRKIREKTAIVIEDAAHALGARTPDGPVGNCAHSDMCCFSFHPVKPITTGEGGLVTTNNADYAERLRRFRSHGIVRKPEHGEWYYEIEELGYNYRLTDIQAALGVSQMTKIDSFIDRRNNLAKRYRELIASTNVKLPPDARMGYKHGYHLFPVLVRNRDWVFRKLREAGVGVQVHYVPIHHHPISSDIPQSAKDLPVCEEVYRQIVSLPIYPSMSLDLQDVVLRELQKLTT